MIGLSKLMTGQRTGLGAAALSAERFRLGERVVADPVRHSIIRDGGTIPVEPRVMQLLTYLAARPGQVISKEELRTKVWRAHVVDEAVHRAVSLLRSALGDTPRRPTVIETVPRHGYRLLVAPTFAPGPSSRPAGRRNVGVAAAAAAAVVVSALLFFPDLRSDPAASPETRAIAASAAPAMLQAEAEPQRTNTVAAAPPAPVSRKRVTIQTPAAAPEAPGHASSLIGRPAFAPVAPTPAASDPRQSSATSSETPRAPAPPAPRAGDSSADVQTPLPEPVRD